MNEKELLALYNSLKSEYELGSIDEFKSYLSDEGNRLSFYNEVIQPQYDVDNFSEFEEIYGLKKKDSSKGSAQEKISASDTEEDTSVISQSDVREESQKYIDPVKKLREISAKRGKGMDNGDGSFSTVLLSSANVDGKNIVYPTLFKEGESFVPLSGDAAIDRAFAEGEVVEVGTAEEADSLAKGAWKGASLSPSFSGALEEEVKNVKDPMRELMNLKLKETPSDGSYTPPIYSESPERPQPPTQADSFFGEVEVNQNVNEPMVPKAESPIVSSEDNSVFMDTRTGQIVASKISPDTQEVMTQRVEDGETQVAPGIAEQFTPQELAQKQVQDRIDILENRFGKIEGLGIWANAGSQLLSQLYPEAFAGSEVIDRLAQEMQVAYKKSIGLEDEDLNKSFTEQDSFKKGAQVFAIDVANAMGLSALFAASMGTMSTGALAGSVEGLVLDTGLKGVAKIGGRTIAKNLASSPGSFIGMGYVGSNMAYKEVKNNPTMSEFEKVAYATFGGLKEMFTEAGFVGDFRAWNNSLSISQRSVAEDSFKSVFRDYTKALGTQGIEEGTEEGISWLGDYMWKYMSGQELPTPRSAWEAMAVGFFAPGSAVTSQFAAPLADYAKGEVLNKIFPYTLPVSESLRDVSDLKKQKSQIEKDLTTEGLEDLEIKNLEAKKEEIDSKLLGLQEQSMKERENMSPLAQQALFVIDAQIQGLYESHQKAKTGSGKKAIKERVQELLNTKAKIDGGTGGTPLNIIIGGNEDVTKAQETSFGDGITVEPVFIGNERTDYKIITLSNGDTVIADKKNERVLEKNYKDKPTLIKDLNELLRPEKAQLDSEIAALGVFKIDEDAIQESSTESVDVQEQAGVSEGVREGDTQEQEISEEITSEVQEPNVSEQAQEESITLEKSAQSEKVKKEVAKAEEDIDMMSALEDAEIEIVTSEVDIKTLEAQKANAEKSISKILPNTKIIIHSSTQEYKDATNNSSGKGEYKIKEDIIHINAEQAQETTIPHEVFHAIFLNAMKTEASAAASAKKMMESVRETLDSDSDLAKQIDKFAENYSENIKDEERLSQLFGIISSEYAKLTPKAKSSIVKFIEALAAAFKVVLPKTFGSTDKSVMNLLDVLAKKTAQGETIRERDVAFIEEEVVEDQESVNIKEGTVKREQVNPDRVRSKYRPGKRISKGVAVKGQGVNKTITETDDLSVAYVKNQAPQAFIKNANILAKEEIVSGKKKFKEIKTLEEAQEVYDIFVREVADNLIFLTQEFNQEYKEISSLWYDGANVLAQNLAKKYDVSEEQVAGIIASLSPQKDWYQNVRLAELTLMAYQANPVMTQEMVDFQQKVSDTGINTWKRQNKSKSRTKKYREDLQKKLLKVQEVQNNLTSLIGVKLKEADLAYQPYYVRTYSELNVTKDYNVLRPDGQIAGVASKKDGTNAKVAWGSYVEIGKAVSIYNDGSQDNITKSLGEMHKIRNFYNNIIDPMSKDGDVTIDTHAVAAGLLKPLSGNSTQVGNNFGTAAGNSPARGIKGTYYAYLEAYALAAKELNLLPRQVQSITWEAVRGLYTDTFKRDKTKLKLIQNIWNKYNTGEITLNEARNETIKEGEGINDPTWAESIFTRARKPAQDDGTRSDGVSGSIVRGSKGRDLESKSRQQKSEAGPKLMTAINLMIKKGYSLEAVELLLTRRGFNSDIIEAGLKKAVKPEASKENLEELNKTIDKSVKRQKEKGGDRKRLISSIDKKLRESKEYKQADDATKKRMEANARARADEAPQRAASRGRILGAIKNIDKISEKEKLSLAQSLIELQKDAAKDLALEIRGLAKLGSITPAQVVAAISRISKVNFLNEISVKSYVDYMAKVFADAQYAEEMNEIRKTLPRAIKNIQTKLGISSELIPTLTRLFGIDPTMIPDSAFKDYLNLVNMFSQRGKVLKLEDKAKTGKTVNRILNALAGEYSLAQEVSMILESYKFAQPKQVEGKSDSEILKTLVKENILTPQMVEVYKKYKGQFKDSVRKTTKKIEEELTEEKIEIIQGILESKLNWKNLNLRDERDLAKKLSSLIKKENLESLTTVDLNNLAGVIDNINNGYLPHVAQLLKEKIEGVVLAKVLLKAIQNADPLKISKAIAKLKTSVMSRVSSSNKRGAMEEMIRRTPLSYIDQIFGDFKGTPIYDSVLKSMAEGQASLDSDYKKISQKVNLAEASLLNSNRKSGNKTLQSKFRIQTYLLQLEYESNRGNSQVQSAKDILEVTIDNYQENSKEREYLEDILENYSVDGRIDLEKLNKSFTPQEKKLLNVIQQLNASLTERAMFTAAIIRGDRIDPINNYVHHNVLLDQGSIDPQTQASDLIGAFIKTRTPSTKAKTLTERTPGVKPLNFDVVSSALRGAKFVLTDYHLTSPLRTTNQVLNIAEKTPKPAKERSVLLGIKNSFKQATDNTLSVDFMPSSIAQDFFDYLKKQGYRVMLASLPRSAVELTSNVVFAAINDPASLAKGTSLSDVLFSKDASEIMTNVKSVQTGRIYPKNKLSGRLIETINESTAVRTDRASKTDALGQVKGYTLDPLVGSVEYIADNLVTSPDKIIMRTVWFGKFATTFKQETGSEPDFEAIRNNDEAYLNKYEKAIEVSKRKADTLSIEMGASDNPFLGILKGAKERGQDSVIQSMNMFNNFMQRFLIYEFNALRKGVHFIAGQGDSRRKGAAIIAASLTRMTMYSYGIKLVKNAFDGLIASIFGIDIGDDEDDKSQEQAIAQALLTTFTTIILGRDMGNFAKLPVALAVEDVNEKYLDFLREGPYNKYEDQIQYSLISPEKGKPTPALDVIVGLSGPYAPAIKSMIKAYEKLTEAEKKQVKAVLRAQREVNERLPLEVLGTLGLIPFYSDVRRIYLKNLYKDMKKGKVPQSVIENVFENMQVLDDATDPLDDIMSDIDIVDGILGN